MDLDQGSIPFMVIGTAGTTNAGVVDPLSELAEFAAEHRLWYHVDAAWGGAAALSDRLKPLLKGMERADSITCDAHKWISVPTGAGMFFCRDRAAVESTFTTQAAYVPDRIEDGRVYPFITTMQWSRRFIGLKVFMMLAEQGLESIARRIEHQTELGCYLKSRLSGRGWKILNETPLPVICFTHPQIEQGAISIDQIVRKLKQEQIAWISRTRLRGQRPALRACITNFNTQPSDLNLLVESLESIILLD
jgi:glutamate/tyrosine decarboxylase-like PLP-dependent enzyme